MPALMVEAVARQVRCTAIALGYNVTCGVLGGLQPAGGDVAGAAHGQRLSPAFMIMAAAVISFSRC